mgnify:CR=1 FL=1
MAASITTLDAILKEFYLGPIEEQLNNETMVIDLFEKATVDWQGKNSKPKAPHSPRQALPQATKATPVWS